jgi:malate synthase
MTTTLEIRGNLERSYDDVLTAGARRALDALAPFDDIRRRLMRERVERRAARARTGQRIAFLDPRTPIGRTGLTAQDAREGRFAGSEIPTDLQRQWIQGTGPAGPPQRRVCPAVGR